MSKIHLPQVSPPAVRGSCCRTVATAPRKFGFLTIPTIELCYHTTRHDSGRLPNAEPLLMAEIEIEVPK